MSRRRPLRLALLVLLLTGAAGAAWLLLLRPPVLRTAPTTTGPAVQAVYATGVVEPVEWAKVTPLVQGRIEWTCRCEGEEVAAGQELAHLESGEPAAELRELEARAAFLAKEVERSRALLKNRYTTPQVHEQALSEHRRVLASIEAAKERLDRYVLRAPIDGVVLRRDGEVGEVVGPQDAMFWVGRPGPLWIVAEVDEEDIPLVAAGQRTLVKADAFPERVLEGTVGRITPKGDPVTKSYRVRITLPPDTPLLVGMTAEVNVIVRETEDAVLAPAAALAPGPAVWLVQDGRAVRRPVTLGVRGAERVELREGPGAGVPVILDPPADLAAGARVTVRRGG